MLLLNKEAEILSYFYFYFLTRKEDLIDISTADTIVRKCRQICKLIIEDNLRQEKPFLVELKREALNMTLEHRFI